MNNLFTGKLTRLVAGDPETVGELYAKWSRDSEFLQLWDTDPPMIRDVKKTQEWFRKEEEKARPGNFGFLIEQLQDGRRIGMTGLWDTQNQHRSAFVSIGIGEREFWGKGYGSDAMNLILQFAFRELNLHRVNLYTFAVNPRAIRSYERVGFVREGNVRGAMLRYGKRGDHVFMGILRDEWENKNRE